MPFRLFRLFRLFNCLAVLLVLRPALSAADARLPRYRVASLPGLGTAEARAVAMNSRRNIVGSQSLAPTAFGAATRRPVKWDGRAWSPLAGAPRKSGTFAGGFATAVNAAGSVVGWWRLERGGKTLHHACLWQAGGAVHIPGSGDHGEAYGINAKGVVVGAYQDSAGRRRAFAWQPGWKELRDLGTLGGASSVAYAVNEHGHVAGVSTEKGGRRVAFIHRDGAMQSLGTLGGATSQATALNSVGHVVGVAQTAGGEYHAFLSREGSIADLGTLGGSFSYASAILGDRVVGVAEDSGRIRRAFLYDGEKLRDLNGLLVPGSGLFLAEANAINRRGEILARARGRDGRLAPVLLMPVLR